MNDLNHGLDLLADEASPAPVDVHDIIAKAKARTRNRRATTATALATVAVAGAMIATIGTLGSEPGPPVGSPPTSTFETMKAIEAIHDERARRFTQEFAAAWPTIAPAGASFTELEFSGHPLDANQDLYQYSAHTTLTDEQGTTMLDITVWPPGVHVIDYRPCQPGPDCTVHQFADGTQAHVITGRMETLDGNIAEQHFLYAMRPDGTRIDVREVNGDAPRLTRPATIFSTEDLFRFATLFTY
jgi:hypothetical protein